MQINDIFFNIDAGSGASIGTGWVELIKVGTDFGVQFLYAKQDNKKNKELLEKMSQLDFEQSEKLKKILSNSTTQVAKTAVIIDFLNQDKIKQLENKTKKDRILPYIGLGFGIILISLIFYKLNKQNNNG